MPNTIIKKLPKPWTIAGQRVTEVELRPPTLDDLVEAELDAHPHLKPTAFNRALASCLLVRAGTFTGPFTPAQFKGMATASWYAIREAVGEAEELGEDEQPSPGPTS